MLAQETINLLMGVGMLLEGRVMLYAEHLYSLEQIILLLV
jgi:hypothetical protein